MKTIVVMDYSFWEFTTGINTMWAKVGKTDWGFFSFCFYKNTTAFLTKGQRTLLSERNSDTSGFLIETG